MSDELSDKKMRVSDRLGKDYEEFRSAARNWSGVYHTFQFGSAVLAAASALLLKSEFIESPVARNDIGALFAAMATLTIVLLTSGRFKEKWEANRIAAFAVRDLQYELEKEGVKLDDVVSSLQKIGMIRNNAVLGIGNLPKLDSA